MKPNKKTRKAFIGLSSPIFWDYRHLAQKVPSDVKSHPNPILESPFGLLLLFDEIYFLCRSLCPQNMRNLDYVHFLDEENLIPDKGESGYFYSLLETLIDKKFNGEEIKFIFNRNIKELKNDWGINWLGKASDHSHQLNIKGLEQLGLFLEGYPGEYELVIDLLVYESLPIKHIEFVTNSFTSKIVQNNSKLSCKSKLVELLLIENIPNYLSVDGPYHPCIEEIREDENLMHFRKFIANQNIPSSKHEIIDIKSSIESSLKEAQDRVFLKYFRDYSFFKSCGKSFCSDILGLFIPGLSTASNIRDKIVNRNIAHKWQSFLVSSRNKVTK